MTKFKVTYSNNGEKCTLDKSVYSCFADNKKEAAQIVEDLKATTASFKIHSIEG